MASHRQSYEAGQTKGRTEEKTNQMMGNNGEKTQEIAQAAKDKTQQTAQAAKEKAQQNTDEGIGPVREGQHQRVPAADRGEGEGRCPRCYRDCEANPCLGPA
ncbi:hypothetical protein JHK82_041059 [Glycine max]|nr:hypothetical protein JHK86_041127 [Glycine max]KAG5104089.1 hypothetical protein JHK82_041059 [Glycine max]KAH1144910.1 hypothetical protein GYH30_040978 [Glycine max]